MIKVILQNTLQQLSDLLVQLNQEEYVNKDELLSGSSIGMHVRHIIEFVQCVITANDGTNLCYDHRKRDITLETSPTIARETISAIIHLLNEVNESKTIYLEGCYGLDQHHRYEIKSTIERELAYNIEHAIHHMAIIKIAVIHLYPHVSVPAHFGIAHSTVQHESIHQA